MIFNLALAMMELFKLYIVSSYLMLAVGMPFGLPAYSFLFLAAFFLNKTLAGRRLRIIQIWLANAAAFGLLFFLVRDSENLIFSGIAILAFYGRAWWLAASAADHEFCVTRFDEGIGLYLLCLTIAALIKFENSFPIKAALPFFSFSILALGLAQGRKSSNDRRFSKSHNAALASSAIAMTLSAIGIAGIVPLAFLPARKAGTVLGAFSLKILAFIGNILEWLFKARKPLPGTIFGGRNESIVYAERGGEEIGTSTIFMWVIIGIFGIGMVLLVGFGLVHLLRYLFSQTGPKTARKHRNLKLILAGLVHRIGLFARGIARVARRAATWIAQRNEEKSPALRAYRKLLACGKFSGSPRRRTETPREYAERLASTFPLSAGSGIPIIEAVEREVYGAKVPDSTSLQLIAVASSALMRRKFLTERLEQVRGNARAVPKKT